MKTTLLTAAPDARWERMDWFLLACVGGILFIGVLFLAGVDLHPPRRATPGEAAAAPVHRSPARKQLIFISLGLVAFFVIQKTDYRKLLKAAPWLYLGGLVSLVAVLFTRPVNNATSWFNLWLFKVQPSELMKPILILTLAHYLMYRESYKRLSGLFVPLLLALVPMAFIVKQPDLGTAMTFVPLVIAVLFAAGTKWRHLSLLGVSGVAGMTAMWFTVMRPGQKKRILAWLNPSEYRLKEAWQLLRAETAIGSGGVFGRGGGSGLGGLDLLPEKHTDFIFAVIAERGGLLTAGVLVLLFLLAAISGLGIAARTREPAGRLIAVGVVALLTGQTLLNIAVTLGLLPTTGVTLPFVSYGGSSMLSSFICLGLLVNVGAVRAPIFSGDDFPHAGPWTN